LTNNPNIVPSIPLEATASDTTAIDVQPFLEADQTTETVIVSKTEENLNAEESLVEGGRECGQDRAREIIETDPSSSVRDSTDEHANTGSKTDLTVYEFSSRPPSTFSLDSHDGPEWQHSPITSIDEDREVRMQSKLQVSSGKVQEIVEMYDGLTKAVSEEPPTPDRRGISQTRSRERSPGRNQIEDDDETNNNGYGFSDFEDALSNDERIDRTRDAFSSSSELSLTPKAEFENGFAEVSSREGEGGHSTVTEAAPALVKNSATKLGHVIFDTNLALLDKLFPELPKSFVSSSTERWEIPDRIVSNYY
jgi:hypothetical protein